MATATVDAILELFTNPRIPPIVGRPNQQSVQDLKRLLYENAASIDSALGGGAVGHLGVIMDANQYQTLLGVPFIPPINPGATLELSLIHI